ncbi:MAG: alpha/beta hydrolase [Bacteroidetes bacterium]|nr:MAG: alpha/beta hydrolase [Bacteroidota bacterium]
MERRAHWACRYRYRLLEGLKPEEKLPILAKKSNMKRSILLMAVSLPLLLFAQHTAPYMKANKVVYLLPGQGADGRLFQRIHIEHYDTVVLEYLIPEKHESMAEYARRMAAQVDTTRPYSFVGVSLGGMVAVEMAKFLQPEETVIIASAKSRHDMPNRYKIFRYFPLHRILGGRFYLWGTRIAQPLFEPMSQEDQALFRAMLREKDPTFMKRAIRCIVEWESESYPQQVLHIHGTDDHTLPFKSAHAHIAIEKGTHTMTLSRAEELSALLNQHIQ